MDLVDVDLFPSVFESMAGYMFEDCKYTCFLHVFKVIKSIRWISSEIEESAKCVRAFFDVARIVWRKYIIYVFYFFLNLHLQR